LRVVKEPKSPNKKPLATLFVIVLDDGKDTIGL
jgi:hypothetical protein